MAKTWGFTIKTSRPRYPQSNGAIERNVQTVKNMITKLSIDGKDLYLSLLELNKTTISNVIVSPPRILFDRNVRSLFP